MGKISLTELLSRLHPEDLILQVIKNPEKVFDGLDAFKRSPIGFFNPAIPTKIISQSRNPDGLYRRIPIPFINFFQRPIPQLKRAHWLSGIHNYEDRLPIHFFNRNSHLHDFRTFAVINSPFEGLFKTNITVGFLAKFVERCTGIAEVMGSNPVRASTSFRSYFHF